jgi:broad specificity phosphatase PhoE
MAKSLIAILQRHGDTEANQDNVFRSRLDPPLNDKGVKQAEDAAKQIAKMHGMKVKKVVASPMLRALQTADIIAEELGLKVTQDRGLISWDLGFLTGRDRDKYKDILDMYIDNPKVPIPDGESLDDLETRLEEFMDKELRTEGTIFVTHNSNCVCIENLVRGNKDGRPESGEKSVEPGGTIGIYVDDKGTYSTEILFGVEDKAAFIS